MEILTCILIFLFGYFTRWFTVTPMSDKLNAVLFAILLGLGGIIPFTIIIGNPYFFADKKEVEYEMISNTYKTSRMGVVLSNPYRIKVTTNKSWMLLKSDPTILEIFDVSAERGASPSISIEVK